MTPAMEVTRKMVWCPIRSESVGDREPEIRLISYAGLDSARKFEAGLDNLPNIRLKPRPVDRSDDSAPAPSP